MNIRNQRLLNEFANSHSLATDIRVEITEHNVSMKPREKDSYAKYEELNLLYDLIRGAEHFLYFLERNGYKIRKGKA